MGVWKPIDENTPRDGTIIILTWMERGVPQEEFAMQWSHIQKNGLFPGKVGMWVTPDSRLTWNEYGGAGPTHWKYPAHLGSKE